MHVHRVVDLSLAVDADTQLYPGDPQVRFTRAATIARDGFNLLGIEMGSQSGTNVDAPYHFREDGPSIDQLDLTLFAGPMVIVDVRNKSARAAINSRDVSAHLDRVGPGSMVTFHTGWSFHYRTPAFLDHPYLGADACRALLERGVRTFCIDTLSVDETPDQHHPGVDFPCHRMIAAANGVVVENLTALEKVDFENPFMSAFPLRLTGADGAPTRAVAMEIGF